MFLLTTSLILGQLFNPLPDISGELPSYAPGNSWISRYDYVYVDNPLFPLFAGLDEDLEMVPIGDYYLTSKQKMLYRLLPFAKAISPSFADHLKQFITAFEAYSMHPSKEQILDLRRSLDDLSYHSFTELSKQDQSISHLDFGPALKEALDAFTLHFREAYAIHTTSALKDLQEHGELLCDLVDDMCFSSCVEEDIEAFDETFLDFQRNPVDSNFQLVLKAINKLRADINHHHFHD